MYKRKCLVCGKEFLRVGRKKFCSPECRRLSYKSEKKQKKENFISLNEMARLQKKTGVSYGNLVAKMEAEKNAV